MEHRLGYVTHRGSAFMWEPLGCCIDSPPVHVWIMIHFQERDQDLNRTAGDQQLHPMSSAFDYSRWSSTNYASAWWPTTEPGAIGLDCAMWSSTYSQCRVANRCPKRARFYTFATIRYMWCICIVASHCTKSDPPRSFETMLYMYCLSPLHG